MSKLSKRMEIRFPEELHQRLVLAAQRDGRSVAALIREAVVERYGVVTQAERLAAVDRLSELAAPVADWERMEDEIAAGALGIRVPEGQ